MSEWQLIGEITPTFEWQVITTLTSGATFRIRQDWAYADNFPGKAYVTLVQRFEDGSLYGFRKFFPYRDPRIFSLYVPRSLDFYGESTYELILKKNRWARYQADADWRITLWRWPDIFDDPNLNPGLYDEDDELPDVIDDPLFDGGRYN